MLDYNTEVIGALPFAPPPVEVLAYCLCLIYSIEDLSAHQIERRPSINPWRCFNVSRARSETIACTMALRCVFISYPAHESKS